MDHGSINISIIIIRHDGFDRNSKIVYRKSWIYNWFIETKFFKGSIRTQATAKVFGKNDCRDFLFYEFNGRRLDERT